jgi:hypothetical protein
MYEIYTDVVVAIHVRVSAGQCCSAEVLFLFRLFFCDNKLYIVPFIKSYVCYIVTVFIAQKLLWWPKGIYTFALFCLTGRSRIFNGLSVCETCSVGL